MRVRRGVRRRVDELRDVAIAGAALLRAQLRVWTRPPGRLVHAAASRPPVGAAPERTALEAAVGRATVALDRAVRRWPLRPGCLVRSLALADLLGRLGVPGGAIRVGVRRRDRALDAHAWVELDGRVVGDDARHVRRFTPLGAVTPAGRR